MRGWYLTTVVVLVLALTLPCQAGYKALVEDWEAWRPSLPAASGEVANPDGKAMDQEKTQERTQDLPQGADPPVSGHQIWGGRVDDLIEEGRFLGAGPGLGKKEPWPVETAQAAIGSAFTLSVLEQITLARNPAILSFDAAFRAELDGFSQVADLDAVLSQYQAFTQGVMTGVGPMRDQTRSAFPFPGSSSLKTRIIVENASMAALTLNIAVRDKVTAIRKFYWNLGLIGEKQTILQETLTLFEHLHDTATTMYQAGKTSYQDVIQIAIRIEVLKNQLASLRAEKRAVTAELLALLDLPQETALGRPKDLDPKMDRPNVSALVAMATDGQQEIRRLAHGVAKMELMIEMAESMVLPSLNLGLSTNQNADIRTAGTWSKTPAFPDQGPEAFMGAGQPKRPWFGSAASWLAQTRKKLTALRHQHKNLQAQARADVQTLFSRLDDALRTHALYKGEIIDLTVSALDVATREYEAGSASFEKTAGAYNNWLMARLALATAKRDVAVFRADLQKAVGLSF